jgi:hypothetical protein
MSETNNKILFLILTGARSAVCTLFLSIFIESSLNIEVDKRLIPFLGHIAKGNVSFCHHLASVVVSFSHFNLLL